MAAVVDDDEEAGVAVSRWMRTVFQATLLNFTTAYWLGDIELWLVGNNGSEEGWTGFRAVEEIGPCTMYFSIGRKVAYAKSPEHAKERVRMSETAPAWKVAWTNALRIVSEQSLGPLAQRGLLPPPGPPLLLGPEDALLRSVYGGPREILPGSSTQGLPLPFEDRA